MKGVIMRPIYRPTGRLFTLRESCAVAPRYLSRATAVFPTGELTALLRDEQVDVCPAITRDWTRQNLHVQGEKAPNRSLIADPLLPATGRFPANQLC